MIIKMPSLNRSFKILNTTFRKLSSRGIFIIAIHDGVMN